jgi:hypothetical protein
VQNKANLQEPRIDYNCFSGKDLWEDNADCASVKTKPIATDEVASSAFGLLAMTRTGEEVTTGSPTGGHAGNRAKQSQFSWSRNGH